MRRLTVLLLLCADAALAHGPDGDASFAEASRHLLLGDHHLSLTILAMAVAAALVYALSGRRQSGSRPGRRSIDRAPAERSSDKRP